MITEDIEHNLGICHTMCDIRSNEAVRVQLQRDYEQWIKDGNEVKVLPPYMRTEDFASFNNQGDLNAAKKRKGWTNEGIAKSR